MTAKHDFEDLARAIGIGVIGSVVAGLALAIFVRPPMPFGVSLLGYTLMAGSLVVAFPLGENLDLERRRGTKRWDMILVLTGSALLLGLVGYLVGLRTPPLIGQSENHILFPGFELVGLFGGAFGHGRFNRR
jgi:amino acid transporter